MTHPYGKIKPLPPFKFAVLTPTTIHLYDVRCRFGGGPNGVLSFPSNDAVDLASTLAVTARGDVLSISYASRTLTPTGRCPVPSGDSAVSIRQVPGFTCILTAAGDIYKCSQINSLTAWMVRSRGALSVQTLPGKSYVISCKVGGGEVWDGFGDIVDAWKSRPSERVLDFCSKEVRDGYSRVTKRMWLFFLRACFCSSCRSSCCIGRRPEDALSTA